MSVVYAVVSVLVAVVALFGTALVLRRWDLPVEAAESRPWWRTWQRTALLGVIAFGFGALGPLSGSLFRGAGAMGEDVATSGVGRTAPPLSVLAACGCGVRLQADSGKVVDRSVQPQTHLPSDPLRRDVPEPGAVEREAA